MYDPGVTAECWAEVLEGYEFGTICCAELEWWDGDFVGSQQCAASEILRAEFLWDLEVGAGRDVLFVLQKFAYCWV